VPQWEMPQHCPCCLEGLFSFGKEAYNNITSSFQEWSVSKKERKLYILDMVPQTHKMPSGGQDGAR